MDGSPGPDALMSCSDGDSSCRSVLDLDDASLCAVLGWLSAKELATAALACSTFRAAAKANLLWLQLIQQEFGILLSSTATVEPAAAMGLYQQLLKGSSKPRALPCRAVCTDGGCDDPDNSTYWVNSCLQPAQAFLGGSGAYPHNMSCSTRQSTQALLVWVQ